MNNIDNTVNLFKAIKKVEDEHEKDGVYFWTTKKLLQTYRALKNDIVNEKVLYSMDLIGLDRSKKIDDNIDILLALPDIDNGIIYRSNKLKAFCTTSEIEQCKNFSNIIDAGMKALKALDKPSYDLLYNAFINKEVKDYPLLIKESEMPTPTYYRHRDSAITKLSIVIFGPFGQRHPLSNFKISGSEKKYKKFFDVADKIEEMFDDGYEG